MLALLAMAATPVGAQQAEAPSGPTLTAFECGTLVQPDLGRFSDTMRFAGERRELIAGCFLIRHSKGVLLWDTGLSPAIQREPQDGMTLTTRIAERLAALGLAPADVTHVGISHYHADHTGGAADFPKAELLIGKADWDRVRSFKRGDPQRDQLAPWLAGGAVTPVEGDRDIFGDGSAVMLAMPGHTPGHSALLVRLPDAGPVLISGDQFHFRENREVGGVPTFNVDRTDTLASHDRFEGIARALGARVVIQHDPRDMAALPPFPASLE
ncbi:N-acyl homoserine lactonase family protein [Sphingomonas japonica]